MAIVSWYKKVRYERALIRCVQNKSKIRSAKFFCFNSIQINKDLLKRYLIPKKTN